MTNALYTATAVSTGEGRNGHVQTPDQHIDADVRMPEALGGPGGATNPEQLFAAGFAACFHSALKLVASREKVDVTDTEVVADVHLLPTDSGGFQLAVGLEVTVPAADREQAQKLVEAAHEVCPYSHATRGNIEVTLTVA